MLIHSTDLSKLFFPFKNSVLFFSLTRQFLESEAPLSGRLLLSTDDGGDGVGVAVGVGVGIDVDVGINIGVGSNVSFSDDNIYTLSGALEPARFFSSSPVYFRFLSPFLSLFLSPNNRRFGVCQAF